MPQPHPIPFPQDRDADPHEDHQAPGGSTVNRAASVATSAALGGAAAGALAGAVGGPAGAAVGAAIGAVAAGLAGNAVVNSVDADVEDSYWRSNFNQRPYAGADADFDDYGPAYRYGAETYVRHPGRRFEEVEITLSEGWVTSRGTSRLDWERARPAMRDSWERLGQMPRPGDPDKR